MTKLFTGSARMSYLMVREHDGDRNAHLEERTYACTTIPDFMQRLRDIGPAFQQLLSLGNIDEEGY